LALIASLNTRAPAHAHTRVSHYLKVLESKVIMVNLFAGPAEVPMVSQNGAIPPIFVPPGYISQVIEENGVRRVVVVPSAVANMGNGTHALPATSPFHHPPMHHIPIPMNVLHHNPMHPLFPHPHVFPNCRPDAIHYMPRPMYIQDGELKIVLSKFRLSSIYVNLLKLAIKFNVNFTFFVLRILSNFQLWLLIRIGKIK